jgi:hypothetical protein
MTTAPREKEHSWRIFRGTGGAATFIGIVKAPNREAAIRRAIEQFEITNPSHQKQLVAEMRET